MRSESLHVRVTSLVGTRRHLREVHGLPEDLIDPDDNHGVIADHIYLHGGRVLDDGSVRWPVTIDPVAGPLVNRVDHWAEALGERRGFFA